MLSSLEIDFIIYFQIVFFNSLPLQPHTTAITQNLLSALIEQVSEKRKKCKGFEFDENQNKMKSLPETKQNKQNNKKINQ
jgi:hypothetical protein